jgi:hypothetical protein
MNLNAEKFQDLMFLKRIHKTLLLFIKGRTLSRWNFDFFFPI